MTPALARLQTASGSLAEAARRRAEAALAIDRAGTRDAFQRALGLDGEEKLEQVGARGLMRAACLGLLSVAHTLQRRDPALYGFFLSVHDLVADVEHLNRFEHEGERTPPAGDAIADGTRMDSLVSLVFDLLLLANRQYLSPRSKDAIPNVLRAILQYYLHRRIAVV